VAKASAKRTSQGGSRNGQGRAAGGKARALPKAKAQARPRQTSRLALSWAQERRRRAEAKTKGAEPKPGSRLRVTVLSVSLLTSVITASAWLGGLFGPALAGVGDMTRTALVDAGFTLAHVEVRGVRHAEAGEVAAALGLEPGALIFDFDPVAAKARVEQLPWVDDAVVLRLLPDRVVVMVDERSPLAVWGGPEGAVVLDADGQTIPSADPASLDGLPRLEGEAAPEAAAALIQALARHPALARRVDGFERVGGRRWDRTLKSGLLIRLPEGEPSAALDRLAALEARENLFEMPLEVIDLRGDDLVLRPRALPAAGPQRGA
jgi:cell division protein FtsQ